jgi:hypothetical protein
MSPAMPTFWTCRIPSWRERRWGGRLSALSTVLALLTLLVVSGPHLVHHFVEQPSQARHHASEDPQRQDNHASPRPDCPILFLLQHTPVAEQGEALLPPLLLAAGSLATSPPLGPIDAPRYTAQARAPPLFL